MLMDLTSLPPAQRQSLMYMYEIQQNSGVASAMMIGLRSGTMHVRKASLIPFSL